jgi:hypothetical protein
VHSFLDGSISQQQMKLIGLPWSQALVQRTLIGTGSAVLAARLALQYGVAAMTNGGTHHAHRGHGSGWCIFNDQAVAARRVCHRPRPTCPSSAAARAFWWGRRRAPPLLPLPAGLPSGTRAWGG